ncbi:hypothetical protein FE257_007286, partial [Aspergillus nanangensis]
MACSRIDDLSPGAKYNVFHKRVAFPSERRRTRVLVMTENLTQFNHQSCLQNR